MFNSYEGIHLTLLIGQAVPRPASLIVMQHFVSVEVAVSSRERSGFEMVFNAVRAGKLVGIYPIMAEPGLQAGARVVIVSTIGVRPQVLIDGIIETAEFKPTDNNTPAKLHVRGKDLTFIMDREEREDTHPAQGPGEIASVILLRYARYGIIPMVIPPMAAERPNPIDRVPMQRGTDFTYLTELANLHDRIFTLFFSPVPLTSVAYWGPPPRIGAPQSAITTDMGPETNVSNLNFENTAGEAAEVKGDVMDRQTGQTIPVRSTAPFRPPLAIRSALSNPTIIRHNLFNTNGAPTAAQAMGEAQSQSDSLSDTLTVTGDLDTGKYGSVLMPNALVGLRGAGFDHDGLYYVDSVVHKIEQGSWSQSFTLNREGVGTTVPVVMP